MNKISFLSIIIAVLMIASCGKNTKEEKTNAPTIKITGDVMELYFPDGSLQGRGGFKAVPKNDNTVNLKNGEWTIFSQESKGTVKVAVGSFSEDKRIGLWNVYYPTGTVKSEMNYKDGKLNGFTKSFTEDGKVTSEILYTDDKINGKKITYSNTGIKTKEEQYKDNKRNGQSITYFPDGKVQIMASYINDKLINNYIEYYPTGNKKMEGRYVPVTEEKIKEDNRWADKEGLKTGPWTLYHSNGNKLMTGVYTENKMTGKWQVYAPEGYLDSEGLYVDNTKDGIWKFYDKSKTLQRELFFKQDMVDGNCRIYDKGKLTGEGNMSGLPKKPNISGIWKEMHSNGKVASEGQYMMNKKNGLFKEFYPTGALQAEGEYMMDKRTNQWKFYKADGKTIDTENTGMYMMGNHKKNLDPK